MPTISEFYKGDTITLSVEIRKKDDNGLFDPASIKISISLFRNKVDISKVTSQDMIKTSTGKYYYDWDSDEAGTYNVEYTAVDGTRKTIGKDTFKVL